MKGTSGDPEAACPVDHKTREAWLQAAKTKGETKPPQHPQTGADDPSHTGDIREQHALRARQRFSLDTGMWTSTETSSTEPPAKRPKIYRLSTDREISTIPRAVNEPLALNSAEKAALPANNEGDTGHDTESGNWVYPSQEMFFNAMRRKGHEADPSDMNSIVPIHNAVNEKAWQEIRKWEEGWGSERCGGPRLISFAGDSKKLTPKARWKSLMGYSAPFDRHDWVVDRCGRRIEYVIDFYKGRGGGISFYLDARPKLNSWDGIKMRIAKTFGW
ncbi:uncharacterized protein MYCFIDRAFT_210968 [Pseudocercospora fijiensis CIRAD86]|uniref:Holocytochrome c-type synthase n=1 Tax=Pseudocercospora fijiensis (strain CIRAD86) TaxID=383855 RepID=M3B5W9_PSEFD|nr:uncharacterized protein MYCFIDRAFT_210968 [Pseudocercospora fijiensis CIRAD86]EME84747.1 hypothetical protein MYCFIDRAFT_210968 [Pseudocercospora fijiensis CIRAD86]